MKNVTFDVGANAVVQLERSLYYELIRNHNWR
jgi:hypothetical protein